MKVVYTCWGRTKHAKEWAHLAEFGDAESASYWLRYNCTLPLKMLTVRVGRREVNRDDLRRGA